MQRTRGEFVSQVRLITQKSRITITGRCGILFLFYRSLSRGLLTQAEVLNDSTITLDVFALEVVEERAALTYHLNE